MVLILHHHFSLALRLRHEDFDSIGYNLDGKNVLVCGQSDIVGRPLVDMLIGRHCNVISVNSTGSRMKATALDMKWSM